MLTFIIRPIQIWNNFLLSSRRHFICKKIYSFRFHTQNFIILNQEIKYLTNFYRIRKAISWSSWVTIDFVVLVKGERIGATEIVVHCYLNYTKLCMLEFLGLSVFLMNFLTRKSGFIIIQVFLLVHRNKLF